MNTSQIKLLAWGSAALLGAGLAGYVAWFASQLSVVSASVPTEQLMEVLQDVEVVVEKSDDVMPYKQVETAIIDLNWTGKPEPVQVVVEKPVEQTIVPRDSVADLVRVMLVSFDAEVPSESRCVLRYTPKAQVRSTPNGAKGAIAGWVKNVGDRLDAPLGHIRVAAVFPDGVEFAYDDEGRPSERVGPGEIVLRGLAVLSDESQLVKRPGGPLVTKRGFDGPTPAKTEYLGEDIYRVGYEDAQYFEENYADILSREVSWQPHRDPRTRRPDGIQITQVLPNSVAGGHGVSTGDIIKSINGTPVTTPQEAVSFIKNNKDKYTKWEVEVESKGQLKTMVYYSPKKD